MAASSKGVILIIGAGLGLFGCAIWCWSAGVPPGSQTVTTTSTVSITSIVVVIVMSCLLSKGMAEDRAKGILRASVVDSFMATDEKALDVSKFQLEDQWGKECGESTGDCIS